MELLRACECGGTLQVSVESAAHNHDLLDVVVTCDSCDQVLNDFININEMSKVEVPE